MIWSRHAASSQSRSRLVRCAQALSKYASIDHIGITNALSPRRHDISRTTTGTEDLIGLFDQGNPILEE
jgi:hypothetical protein